MSKDSKKVQRMEKIPFISKNADIIKALFFSSIFKVLLCLSSHGFLLQ
jgi:hypothetical protein